VEALPESIAAFGNLKPEYAIMLWLMVMTIMISPALRRVLAMLMNAVFKTKFNTNGGTTEAIAKEAQAKADAVSAELRKHEDGCAERYALISKNFEKLFDLHREQAKAIARVEGFINGLQRVKEKEDE